MSGAFAGNLPRKDGPLPPEPPLLETAAEVTPSSSRNACHFLWLGALPVFGKDATHPRAYGNNSRVLGLYVREKKAIPLEEAIRKMTSLPAAHFKLSGRGLVKEGYAADLVLFDPAKISDAATFEKPHAYAMGFQHVLVNGVPVIDGGTHTGAKAGRPILPD